MTEESAPPAIRFCGTCGAPRAGGTASFCASCGTPFAELPAVGAEPPAPAVAWLPKAGFWIRTAAYLIDLFILGLVSAALETVAGEQLRSEEIDLLVGLLSVAYFVVLWSSVGRGQTIGMRALGLRVVRVDGSALSAPRAFLRQIGLSLGAVVFGLGLLAVAFDEHKQGWHDKLVGTYVIRAGPRA